MIQMFEKVSHVPHSSIFPYLTLFVRPSLRFIILSSNIELKLHYTTKMKITSHAPGCTIETKKNDSANRLLLY